MAKLSKVDAAKAVGVSRQTLYTYLKDGRLSADADGLVDTAELLRAGFTLHAGQSSGHQEVDTAGHGWTSRVDTLDISLDMIAMLKQQLTEAQAREQAAQERERDYREHIARLTAMLDQAHQQNQRLLDLPRTPRPGPQAAPGPPQPPSPGPRAPTHPRPRQEPSADPRGAMRRRIVALLQEHPAGLTTGELRALLGVERSVADTLLGMLRYGLVQRIDRGTYVAVPPSPRYQGGRS